MPGSRALVFFELNSPVSLTPDHVIIKFRKDNTDNISNGACLVGKTSRDTYMPLAASSRSVVRFQDQQDVTQFFNHHE
jgi:hypothetical protein